MRRSPLFLHGPASRREALFVLLCRALEVAEAAAAIPYHLTDADGKVLVRVGQFPR